MQMALESSRYRRKPWLRLDVLGAIEANKEQLGFDIVTFEHHAAIADLFDRYLDQFQGLTVRIPGFPGEYDAHDLVNQYRAGLINRGRLHELLPLIFTKKDIEETRKRGVRMEEPRTQGDQELLDDMTLDAEIRNFDASLDRTEPFQAMLKKVIDAGLLSH